MRILYASDFGGLGGAERSLLELMISIRPLGIEPVLLCPPGPLFAAADAARIAVVPWAARRCARGERARAIARVGLAWAELDAALRRFRPFAVHANTTRAMVWLGPVPALRRCRVVWHWRDFEHRRAIAAHLTADIVIAISRAVEVHAARVLGATRRLVLVRNGIADVQRAPATELRSALALPADATVVAMGGQAVPHKGHALLIAALSRLLRRDPTLHGVLACSELDLDARAYTRQLRALAAGEPRIRILTDLPVLHGLFRASDVVAVPSLREPFGRVAVEAMLAERPVVASAVDGLAEIVADGETGLLVPPGDPVRLADALERVLVERDLWRARGASARRRALEELSITRVAAEVAAVYGSLAGSLAGSRIRA